MNGVRDEAANLFLFFGAHVVAGPQLREMALDQLSHAFRNA
jgi:hypothetical protein